MPAESAAAPPRGPYRGALLGFGGIARQSHLPAFARDADVRARLAVVAAVDGAPAVPPPDALPLLRDRDALAALGPIDFVDICTPTASHLELTLWALSQGFHVLCEKPVACSAADARRIAEAARAARRVVVPCHQYRFNPVWRQVQAWLGDGAIGRWHLAELSVSRTGADRGAATGAVPWRGRREASAGGIVLDHGTHLVYELLDAAGMPERVRAWTGRLAHTDYDVEDSAHLLLEWPGRAATVFLTWAGRERENRVRFVGARGAIEWRGGVLRLERDGRVETRDMRAQLEKSAYADWFAELLLSFADAMDTGDGEGHLRDVGRVAAVLDAAYRAAATGAASAVDDTW